MVKNPGETPGVGTIRPLNPPVPTGVIEDGQGRPVAVTIGTGQAAIVTNSVGALRVTTIEDHWEIDDEWWRTKRISRAYYRVLLEDAQALTLYRDMLNGRWYNQRY